MNKAIGLGIGVIAVVISVTVWSTIFTDTEFNSFTSIPNEDSNEMMMGDKISVSVTSSEEVADQEEQVTEEVADQEEQVTEEGKSLKVNLIDGVSATSTP